MRLIDKVIARLLDVELVLHVVLVLADLGLALLFATVGRAGDADQT